MWFVTRGKMQNVFTSPPPPKTTPGHHDECNSQIFRQFAKQTNLLGISLALSVLAAVVATPLLISSVVAPQVNETAVTSSSAEEVAGPQTQLPSVVPGEVVLETSALPKTSPVCPAPDGGICLDCENYGGRETCILSQTFDGEGQDWQPPCEAYDDRYKCKFLASVIQFQT